MEFRQALSSQRNKELQEQMQQFCEEHPQLRKPRRNLKIAGGNKSSKKMKRCVHLIYYLQRKKNASKIIIQSNNLDNQVLNESVFKT